MDETYSLPTLVLSRIFSFLTLKERLRAKRVCKLWKFLIDQIVQQRLCLYAGYAKKPWQIKWNDGSNVTVKEQDKLQVINERRYPWTNQYLFVVANALSLGLRKLYLYKLTLCSRFMKEIENFKRLDELAIEATFNSTVGDKLTSSSLQTISFKVDDHLFSGFPLQLDTPSLTRFIFWNGGKWEITMRRISPRYPEKIVYMECQNFWFLNMPNLEHLVCHWIEDNIDFRNYPKLRKLEYYPNRCDQALAVIERLKEHQRWFNPDLEIFVSGFDLDAFCEAPLFFDLNPSDHSEFSINEGELAIFSSKFSKLTNQFPWRLAVNYPLLRQSFVGQVAGGFFKIFPSSTR